MQISSRSLSSFRVSFSRSLLISMRRSRKMNSKEFSLIQRRQKGQVMN